ncbi:MAG: ABC transporter permease subunit [Nitrospinaceae bacterium]|nr:phosphate ABC transporter permease PstA [Nitrospinaceae bacterium]NIR55649.1 phosphate ABC transporter permease PstA [Nitrospinaceae bacterium]NIS86091.1 phosphate ABC transporter permease PstA [Nitrospinaceae bacterium]NIT82935.1 phosphate ABC transporter permease PstA [Nitrospinaceae bacterium]NIU45138.1 phosphate ABC transporter permease PstA [Nitrospinaceae bacterium]
MNRRLWKEKFSLILLTVLTSSGVLVLAVILFTVFWKGSPAISGSFLLEASRDFGLEGGVFYQLLGTMLLMTGAALVCLPVALGSVLFQTEFLHSPLLKKMFRHLIYSLNAVPTILFGLMGYLFFGVFLDSGISWLTGVLILAVMILPTLHVSIHEAVESIPEHYRESGLALGLSSGQLIRAVVLPQSVHGIVTGTLLGLARAAGETAAIMFTATTFSGVLFPESWTEPVTTLQTHILVLAQEAANPAALGHAWGAASVLLTLVFVLIAAAWWMRTGISMEAER